MKLRIVYVCPSCNGRPNADSTNMCMRCMGEGKLELVIENVIDYEKEKD